jgi:hypothetical protein
MTQTQLLKDNKAKYASSYNTKTKKNG